MSFSYKQPIDVEYVKPPNIRKFHKKVWDGKEWADTQYVEIWRKSNSTEWLIEHYGNPKYQSSWWQTTNHIIMTEKVYTHWSLANE